MASHSGSEFLLLPLIAQCATVSLLKCSDFLCFFIKQPYLPLLPVLPYRYR